MTVYADVLIFLNMFVNFFILQLTAKICKDGYKIFRMISAALVGALFSLYIFLPKSPFLVEAFFKLVISAVIILICFGFDSIKSLLRRIGIFFATSFLYGGIMLAIWSVLKPENMAINNGIVYLNISPVILILATLISYFFISLIRFLSSRHANIGNRYEIEIYFKGSTAKTTALADTGNSLSDSITDTPVLIIEKSIAEKLLSTVPTADAVASGDFTDNIGFRLLPYSYVGGHGLLPAFKADKVVIKTGTDTQVTDGVLLAISTENLGEDYKAIINPDILK